MSFGAKKGKYLLFGHDETGCVGGGGGGGGIESRRFERKFGGRLFSKYYSRLLQFIKSGRVLARSFR